MPSSRRPSPTPPHRRGRPTPDGGATRPEPDLRRAVERVGDRWVLLIVAALLEGPHRFGELADGLGVAPNILTARLRQLTDDGLVVARPYSERPLRHTYALTAAGRDLAQAIGVLAAWGSRRRGGTGAGPFHGTCGTPLELRPWCPTCERDVDPGEASDAIEV